MFTHLKTLGVICQPVCSDSYQSSVKEQSWHTDTVEHLAPHVAVLSFYLPSNLIALPVCFRAAVHPGDCFRPREESDSVRLCHPAL